MPPVVSDRNPFGLSSVVRWEKTTQMWLSIALPEARMQSGYRNVRGWGPGVLTPLTSCSAETDMVGEERGHVSRNWAVWSPVSSPGQRSISGVRNVRPGLTGSLRSANGQTLLSSGFWAVLPPASAWWTPLFIHVILLGVGSDVMWGIL